MIHSIKLKIYKHMSLLPLPVWRRRKQRPRTEGGTQSDPRQFFAAVYVRLCRGKVYSHPKGRKRLPRYSTDRKPGL